MILARRVADVHFPQSQSFGSGYFLSNRLVLTAGHVAEPDRKGTPCVVHRWKLVDEAHAARILWASRDSDLALVMLNQDIDADLGDPPQFGDAIDCEGAETYACESIGFPIANRTKDDRWIDKVVKGWARKSFRGGFDIEVNGLRPSDSRDWRGLSGAALFSRDLLFGVFQSVPPKWGGGLLQSVSLRPVLDRPDFRAALEEGGMPGPVVRPMPHSDYYRRLSQTFERYYYLIDREQQATELEIALSQGNKRAFLAQGGGQARFDFLMQRFAGERCFRDALMDTRASNAIFMLGWPSEMVIRDVPRAFEAIRDEFMSVLSLENGSNVSDIVTWLGRRPVAVWWQFNVSMMGDGHAELLKRWTDFCLELQNASSSFYWFACSEEEEGPVYETGGIGQQPDPGVRQVVQELINNEALIVLPRLPVVRAAADLPAWIRKIPETSQMNDEMREHIRASLVAKFGMGGFQLADLCNQIEETLRGFDAR